MQQCQHAIQLFLVKLNVWLQSDCNVLFVVLSCVATTCISHLCKRHTHILWAWPSGLVVAVVVAVTNEVVVAMAAAAVVAVMATEALAVVVVAAMATTEAPTGIHLEEAYSNARA